ncbi:divalent-cation tolerance protein CutA [Synechocystis sp. PCC 7509]|uniref:divalent-cation tolerance protein CutA n=1 Tax=Synechocystis sp. PCC 7509 TaxID=927677 RepID=UPI0002AC311B|nr:divalent-cation tolerance protein CutA [Synechocystis sp. PCC 7509]
MDNNPQLLSSASYGVVLVSASSQIEAEKIATALVESQLAACVSLMPITSIYTWQNKLHQDQEWQLIIKTKQAMFAAIINTIQELHSYEVPEIIALPLIAGSQSYLQWISKQVKQSEEV